MRNTITRPEALLLAIGGLLLLAAGAGPHVGHSAHYHAFADQRALWGVPHALDVVSNLLFALGGLAGLWLLRAAGGLGTVQRGCARLFCAGLVLTAAASAYYHLQPEDVGLALDRAGMSFAFAGLLGLLACVQVSDRAGRWLAMVVLLLAPGTIAVALASGNILPWALLQGGGLVLLLVFGCMEARPGALRVRWLHVLAIYALAKAFEAGDHLVFDATGGIVSGHTLKHVVAALAAWPVIAAVAALRPVQNATTGAAAARA